MPVRRLAMLFPLKYTTRLFAVESNYLQTTLHEQQKYVEALKVNSNCLQVLQKRFGARSTERARELINRSFLLDRLGEDERGRNSGQRGDRDFKGRQRRATS